MRIAMPACSARSLAFLCLVGGLLWGASPAWACSVPVFRYALERWHADPYQVFVFHRGDLTPTEQEALGPLAARPAEEAAGGVNVHLVTVDLDAEPDHPLQQLWEAEQTAQLPWVIVRTPRQAEVQTKIWSGRLEADALPRVIDSPLRREAARRILQGESAVWVLLEIGNPERDDAAAAMLERELRRLQDELKLPDQDPTPGLDDLGEESTAAGVELKLGFSLLRLSRDDPDEQTLVTMLLESEPDLKELDHPMAFPIFGRGRSLYALVGAGINPDVIQETCEFLIGPCSCQVKDLNPGTDLLMAVDWDRLIQERVVIDRELPPLSGLSKFIEPELAAATLTTEPAGSADEDRPAASVTGETRSTSAQQSETSGLLGRNLLIVTLLALFAVVAGTALLLRKT